MCSLIYGTTTLGKGSGKFEIRNKQASEIEEKQRSKSKDSLLHKRLMDLSETLRDFRNGNGPFWKCLKASEIWRSDLSDEKSIYSLQLFAELSLGRRRTNKHQASYEISLKREEEEEVAIWSQSDSSPNTIQNGKQNIRIRKTKRKKRKRGRSTIKKEKMMHLQLP
jgi:hypothetical protein